MVEHSFKLLLLVNTITTGSSFSSLLKNFSNLHYFPLSSLMALPQRCCPSVCPESRLLCLATKNWYFHPYPARQEAIRRGVFRVLPRCGRLATAADLFNLRTFLQTPAHSWQPSQVPGVLPFPSSGALLSLEDHGPTGRCPEGGFA